MELVSFYTIYSVYLVISGSLEVWKIIQFFIWKKLLSKQIIIKYYRMRDEYNKQ